MKKETIEVLKNFSGLNQGIIFRPGNVLRTISGSHTVFATALVPDTFDREFAIYDLNEFLSTLSLFDSPEVKHNKDHMEISAGPSRVLFQYSAPSVVVAPDANKVIEIDVDFSFELPATTLEQTMKASSVMKLKTLEFSTSGIRAFNKNEVGNQYEVRTKGLEGDGKALSFSIENIRLLNRDYTVKVGRAKGMPNEIAEFTSIDGALKYVVAADAS